MILGVTGHRPLRLALRHDQQPTLDRFALHTLAESFVSSPRVKVITGMAQGWDQAIARAAAGMSIPYIAAIPFEGFEEEWPEDAQSEYRALLAGAAEVKLVSTGKYHPKKMSARNRWIVDNSTALLALWDGYDNGGTAHCVRYARERGVRVRNVWLDWRDYLRLRDPEPFPA